MEGIKRLAKMLEGQKDKYLNIIVKYLMQHTELDQAFQNKEKNLKDMAEYIKGKAKKQATGGVAVIEDAIVFEWAIDYFIKSNEELKIKKATTKKDEVEKVKNDKTADEFGSIFDTNNDEKTDTKKEEVEQISLFSSMCV